MRVCLSVGRQKVEPKVVYLSVGGQKPESIAVCLSVGRQKFEFMAIHPLERRKRYYCVVFGCFHYLFAVAWTQLRAGAGFGASAFVAVLVNDEKVTKHPICGSSFAVRFY